jgi:hypothetical protein
VRNFFIISKIKYCKGLIIFQPVAVLVHANLILRVEKSIRVIQDMFYKGRFNSQSIFMGTDVAYLRL